MHSFIAPLMVVGLASLAQAFTKPTNATWGPLLLPDTTHPVTQGETFKVTWDPESHPTDDVTVSLVLCHGPSTNCVQSDSALASGIPASSKSFSWDVPCDLAPGTQSTSTGYGMLIIVDGTGEFQYSTQFSVLEGKTCSKSSSGSSNSTSPSSTVTNSGGSVVILPPTQQTGSAHSGSNGTTTGSGPNWGGSAISMPTTTATDMTSMVSVTFSSGYIVSETATITSAPTGATAASATTGSAPASTFTGAAAQLALNGAGMALAGAAAFFVL
ncbi:uncharacterized protein PV06_05131 [Exophiala oligosperma]|uniref:Yeast cell wall synthesis Kre9/Knh1-like N-terminal domain-containing protein n=1 Tax=Exophiala oligosperma TaxID=215243 RepID=A0A0D2AWC4_9EURO|nr:uncharacterized protein PV06_05131 [Exophiala oligosperma]KIW44091.1 hypothetical protein PV06_05131 [Exophiala oligosperma]